MAKKTNFDYDKKADILYISFSPGEEATSAVELNDNILLRINFKEKRAVGLTLKDYSVLVQSTDLGPRSFPLTGLKELEPEWQEMVVEMITKTPVSQILRLSICTPSFKEEFPIVYIERTPISLAA